MPEEFDPDWEYYAGDPEVEELLAEASGRAQFDNVKATPGFNPGIIYHSRLDHYRTKLGRERVTRERERKPPTPRTRRPDRPRVLTPRKCMNPACGAEFNPKHRGHVYCGHGCSVKRPDRETLLRFREAYESPELKVEQVAAAFGIRAKSTVYRWVKWSGAKVRSYHRARHKSNGWRGRVWLSLSATLTVHDIAQLFNVTPQAVRAGIGRARLERDRCTSQRGT